MITRKFRSWHKVRRIGKQYWCLVDEPELGLCWTTRGKQEDAGFIKRLFLKRKNKRCAYQGKRSYAHQPVRFIKCGWYFEYMRSEWAVTTGTRRRSWLVRLLRRANKD